MTINERISYIMKIKAGGSLYRFAEILDIKNQYATRLIKDGSVGIEPISRILRTWKDINPRWLILNEGDPFVESNEPAKALRNVISTRINLLLDLERWIPAMSDTDMQDLVSMLSGEKEFILEPTKVAIWEKSIGDRERTVKEKVKKAMEAGICKTPKDKQ